jgi:hypothetical protein
VVSHTRELVEAKIVTQIVDPDRFALSGISIWRDKEAVERGLLEIPLYNVIRANDQESFEKLSANFSESLKLGKSGPEITKDVQAVLSTDVLPRYLKVAPDGVVQRYWRSQIAEMRHLFRTDPSLCIAFAFPEKRRNDYNPVKLLPAALLDEDIAALTQLIEHTSRSPQNDGPLNLDEEFAGVLKRISVSLPVAPQVLGDPAKHLHDPRTLCAALIAFYDDILALPTQQSGRLLRSIGDPAR